MRTRADTVAAQPPQAEAPPPQGEPPLQRAEPDATRAPQGEAPPRLSFRVTGSEAERYSAAPTVNLTLAIAREGGGPIRSLLLDVQVQIAARRRSYEPAERARLHDLFGTSKQWSTTLRTLLWTRSTLVVPPFEQETEATLPLACSYDLEASAASYLSGLQDGEVPLELLFSGSAFYAGADGALQVARISWEAEAEHMLPVRVWREAMDRHFPGCAWVRISKQSFEKVRACRSKHGLVSTQDALDRLLGEG